MRKVNSLMNSGLRPAGLLPRQDAKQGPEQNLREQMEAWRGLLGRCGRKPGRKRVHKLRVATLRLRAELEDCAGAEQKDAPAADAARRWRRHGKKVRRWLGPVRQADVYLGMLKRLRKQAGAAANGHLQCPQECLSAMGGLERGFEQRRQKAAKELAARLDRHKRRFRGSARKVERALELRPTPAGGCSSRRIAEEISAAAREFPELNEGNLHAFRKRIKKIRYQAELAALADPGVARRAAGLKRMASAAGEWHDWQALAAEAGRAGRENAEFAALAEFMQALAGQTLERALALCRRSMAQVSEGPADGQAAHEELADDPARRPVRKPVVSVAVDLQGVVTEKPLTEPGRSVRAS
ncbi:MAG: CHAD domain-containing protein [Terracidiphilus sp.]